MTIAILETRNVDDRVNKIRLHVQNVSRISKFQNRQPNGGPAEGSDETRHCMREAAKMIEKRKELVDELQRDTLFTRTDRVIHSDQI